MKKEYTELELRDRQQKMDANFPWTAENVNKLLTLNDRLYELMKELLATQRKMEQDLDNLITAGKSYFENYNTSGFIIYDDDLPQDDHWLSRALHNSGGVWAEGGCWLLPGPPAAEEMLMDELSWNIEKLNRPEFRGHEICYFMHILHEHGYYSFSDLCDLDLSKLHCAYKIEI